MVGDVLREQLNMTQNLADEVQIKNRNKEIANKRTIEVLELKKLLEQKPMRDFVWRLLEHSKTFHSIWEQSAKIHYNAGQQDFGHFIMAEVQEANEESLFQMMRENKEKKEEKQNV